MRKIVSCLAALLLTLGIQSAHAVNPHGTVISSGPFIGIYIPATGDVTGAADAANLQVAVAELAANHVLPPSSSAYVPQAGIMFGPGVFYYTSSLGNILGSVNTLKLSGISFTGQGRGVTWLDYNPGTSGPMLVNNRGLELKFSDLTFFGHDANSDLLWDQEQAGVSNIQDETWVDVDVVGSWHTVERLTGGNNNSEHKFERVTFGSIGTAVYTPAKIATTITNGSSSIVVSGNVDQVEVGDTGQFSAAVAPLSANTQYYVVAATTTSFQVSTTFGGSPVSFTASGTPNFNTASDQFLNYWFHDAKLDSGSALGQLLVLNYGGNVYIDTIDISGHAPASPSCVFNLLNSAHAGGTMRFRASGRIEHLNDNSCTIHSQWGGGSIEFDNWDESSQAGNRTITDKFAQYEIINAAGPLITYNNSQLMGQHSYTSNGNNFGYQSQILYNEVTLLDNPTAANFISITGVGGNSGGYPRISFRKSRNLLYSGTVGYHEVVDTDINWNTALGGQTSTKTTSCVGANSDWPISGGTLQIRLPLNAMLTQIRVWKPGGTGNTGAYNYTFTTTEATPTTVLGPITGAGAGTPIAYGTYSSTPNLMMTSDALRTLIITDVTGRAGAFTGLDCLIDYIG